MENIIGDNGMTMDCPPVNLIHLQLSVRPVVWLTNLIRQDESIMAFQIDLFVGEQFCVFNNYANK